MVKTTITEMKRVLKPGGVVMVTFNAIYGSRFGHGQSLGENTWILNIRSQMLQQFAGLMPGLLRDIVLGSSGLMYVAVGLAGLVGGCAT